MTEQIDDVKLRSLMSNFDQLNADFSANDYRGSLTGDVCEYIQRDSRILLTALHSVKHFRDGAEKEQDKGTGALVRILGELSGVSTLVARRTVPGEGAWANRTDEIKAAADLAIKNAHLVIDFHGMRDRMGPEICIGRGRHPTPAVDEFVEMLRRSLTQIRVSIDDPFAARKPYTLTNYCQTALSVDAIQLELTPHFRSRENLVMNEVPIQSLAVIAKKLKERDSLLKNDYTVHQSRIEQPQRTDEIIIHEDSEQGPVLTNGAESNQAFAVSKIGNPSVYTIMPVDLKKRCKSHDAERAAKEKKKELLIAEIRMTDYARELLSDADVGDLVSIRFLEGNNLNQSRLRARRKGLHKWSILGAPSFELREEKASGADESSRIVRIPEAAFPVLGIQEGDKIVVSWLDKKTKARAFKFSLENNSAPGASGRTLDHSISIPHSLRNDLGLNQDIHFAGEEKPIPGRSFLGVVTVRRSIAGVYESQILKILAIFGALVLLLTSSFNSQLFLNSSANSDLGSASQSVFFGLVIACFAALLITPIPVAVVMLLTMRRKSPRTPAWKHAKHEKCNCND